MCINKFLSKGIAGSEVSFWVTHTRVEITIGKFGGGKYWLSLCVSSVWTE